MCCPKLRSLCLDTWLVLLFSTISYPVDLFSPKNRTSDVTVWLTHSRWLEIDVDVLPVMFGRGVHLVHYANMWVLLDDLVPPVPALAVRGAMREGMERFNVLPVRECDERVGGLGVRADPGRSFTKNCHEELGVRPDQIPSTEKRVRQERTTRWRDRGTNTAQFLAIRYEFLPHVFVEARDLIETWTQYSERAGVRC